MLDSLLFGFINLCITVVIHGLAMLVVTRLFRWWTHTNQVASIPVEFFRVILIVILLFSATLLEALWWCGSYVYLGVIDDVEPALYFSLVTYTTLGYGDITLDAQWRLLSAFQAANGVLIAGWSTALLFAWIQKMYTLHHPVSRL